MPFDGGSGTLDRVATRRTAKAGSRQAVVATVPRPNVGAVQARQLEDWARRMAGLLEQPLSPKLRATVEARVARLHRNLPKWSGPLTREQVARSIAVAAAQRAAGNGTEVTEVFMAKLAWGWIAQALTDRAAPPNAIQSLKIETVSAALAAFQRGRGAPSGASGVRGAGGAAKALHAVFVELKIDDGTTAQATARLLTRKVPVAKMRKTATDWFRGPPDK